MSSMERKLPERYYSPPPPPVTSSETLFASANPYGWPNMLQPIAAVWQQYGNSLAAVQWQSTSNEHLHQQGSMI